jgi:hypothetical protein
VDFHWPQTRLASLLGLTLGLAVGGPARAADDEDRVRLALPVAGLPFSSTDLESAVQTRLALVRDGGPATEVTVTPTPTPGSIMVISARRLEEVSVAGKSPDEAARLVALAVVAVVRPAGPAEATAFGGGDAGPAGVPGLAARATAGTGPARGSFSLAAATGIAFRLAGDAATSESTIEGAWAWGTTDGAGRRPWQIALGLGFARARVNWSDRAIGGAPAGGFDLDTFPVRLGLRHRWGFLVAGAGPVLRLFRTGGIDEGTGAVAGGFAQLGADVALGHGFRATATAACDLDSERLVFRAAGQPVLTAGPLIPWLGLGLAWGTP